MIRFIQLGLQRDRRHVGAIGGTLIGITIVENLFLILAPFLLEILINSLVERRNYERAMILVVTYVGFLFSSRFLDSAMVVLYGYLWKSFERSAISAVYSKIFRASHGYHLEMKVGKVAKIVSDGIDSGRALLNSIVYGAIPVALQIIVIILVFLLQREYRIFFGTLVFATIYGLVFYRGTRAQRKLQAASITLDQGIAGDINDFLNSISTIKLFGAEERADKSLEATLSADYKSWQMFFASQAFTRFALSIIFGFSLLSLLYFSCEMTFTGRMSIGTFVLINAYVLQIVEPIERIGNLTQSLGKSLINIEKLTSLLDIPAEPEGFWHGERLPRTRDHALKPVTSISTSGLTLSARSGKKLFKNLNVSAGTGEVLGIFGKSGSGKSSLLRILLKLSDPDQGQVYVNKNDSRNVPAEVWRKNFAVVSQTLALLNKSVLENFRFFNPHSSDDDIDLSTRITGFGFDRSVTQLDHDMVGQSAARLSGGERQRVAIAMALMRKAGILVFDEAFSSLDGQSERKVFNDICAQFSDKIIIVISHRIIAAQACTKVLFIDEDAHEVSTHEALIRQNRNYANMWAESLEFANN